MNDTTYYLLAYSLIAVLCAFLVYCGYQLKKELKERSVERSEARRAASRPKAYQQVHDNWTVFRNRRSLWDSVKK
ncbi:hypothetical protein [Ruminococcus flavefaciens]|uniref:hypothetical protein n=1 Tax=Ruminococcus flavefaciens TaxID=1265 RepID=UPI0026EFE1ED|nr:hypothetical protein [Ruminococcus flavefaciens]